MMAVYHCMLGLIVYFVLLAEVHTSPSQFSSWTGWDRCSSECLQTRSRTCEREPVCADEIQTERRSCFRSGADCNASRGHRGRNGGNRGRNLYSDWSDWSACTRSCKQRRLKTCRNRRRCKNKVITGERTCQVAGAACGKRSTTLTPGIIPVTDRTTRKRSRPTTTVTPGVPAQPYNASTCGIRPAVPSHRIVGGRASKPYSWPWQVALVNKFGEQYCGGVLIAPQFVLTAAHCVQRNNRVRRYTIRIAEHDIGVQEGPEIVMRSQQDYVYPDYDWDSIDNDIAVLRLPVPVPESQYIKYACVADADDVLPDGELCHVVGWGKMKNTHIYGTDVLREVKVPLVPQHNCTSAFEFDLTPSMMCAGHERGGRDSCAGDSGGPLMCVIEKEGVRRWHVYGVTSFGEGCGEPGKYGVYSRVNMFSDWIVNVTMGK